MTAVAKLELRRITKFQEEIHTSQKRSDGTLENIDSIFQYEFRKCTWYTRLHSKMPCIEADDEYVFKANMTFHYLLYSYILQHYPSVSIKPSYRKDYKICWGHNLPIHTIEEARFEVDEVVYNTLDNVWLDDRYEYFMKRGAGFRKSHNTAIGNLPKYERWSDELESHETTLDQPWYYSRSAALAFPLFYCGKDSTVSHFYRMKTKISETLRMAKRVEGGKWIELKEVDFSVLEDLNEKSKLKKPEMWAAYGYVRDRYIEYSKNCAGSDKKVFYIEDVVACDQTNTTRYGKTVSIDLDCDKPCKSIFWKAENTDATVRRNFSNYTTEVNLYKGECPIDRVSLKYGDSHRFKNMKTLHFSRMQPWYHLSSAPSVQGYNVYALADDVSSLDADAELTLSELKSKMLFKLRNPLKKSRSLDSREYRDLEDDSEDCSESYSASASTTSEFPETKTSPLSQTIYSPNFRMRVRLLVIRKLVIEKTGEDQYTFSLD